MAEGTQDMAPVGPGTEIQLKEGNTPLPVPQVAPGKQDDFAAIRGKAKQMGNVEDEPEEVDLPDEEAAVAATSEVPAVDLEI